MAYIFFYLQSKRIWIRPLKNKTAKVVLEAMKSILREQKPKKVRADRGSEFVNRWFKKLMKEEGIYFFYNAKSHQSKLR